MVWVLGFPPRTRVSVPDYHECKGAWVLSCTLLSTVLARVWPWVKDKSLSNVPCSLDSGRAKEFPLSEQHLVKCQTWMVTERRRDLGAGQSVGVEVEVCGG